MTSRVAARNAVLPRAPAVGGTRPSTELGSPQSARILQPVPGRSIGATVRVQGVRDNAGDPRVFATASIPEASGLSVHATTTSDGASYTVDLEYRALPGVPMPPKDEQFVVSVVVTDAAGAYVNSFAAGVLFI